MIASGAVLFPGAAACFARLSAAFPLAIASGSFHAEIEHVLNGAGLLHHFSAIVGADDAARSKPHPAPYLEAARRLGTDPSECVAIEDSAWGLESARTAGMKTIAVTNSYPASQLRADWIVESLDAHHALSTSDRCSRSRDRGNPGARRVGWVAETSRIECFQASHASRNRDNGRDARS